MTRRKTRCGTVTLGDSAVGYAACHCGINLSADIGKLVYKLSENRPVQAPGQKLFTLC
jgi:hypothetical protein